MTRPKIRMSVGEPDEDLDVRWRRLRAAEERHALDQAAWDSMTSAEVEQYASEVMPRGGEPSIGPHEWRAMQRMSDPRSAPWRVAGDVLHVEREDLRSARSWAHEEGERLAKVEVSLARREAELQAMRQQVKDPLSLRRVEEVGRLLERDMCAFKDARRQLGAAAAGDGPLLSVYRQRLDADVRRGTPLEVYGLSKPPSDGGDE